ncbi:MAG TPA: diguanylate cyclase [Terriglobales bacterium]|nr:diguanylate cyclase [Terriglobales bacterium]
MRILVAEDSVVYQRLVTNHLKDWGFDYLVAKTGSEAWDLLQKPDAPRLALLDWVLPDIDGIELCRRIRSRHATEPYIYAVLLTAKTQKQDLLKAMEAGADDYLTKPFDAAELKARLLAGSRILETQEQLVRARESYRVAATHDALTGIWNRAEVIDFLRREIARARRSCGYVGVVLVDIDHFKKVNDSIGHLAGDVVLKEVACRLRSGLRIYDGVGRYGGEEFLLVLPGCDLETTTSRANELRATISGTSVVVGPSAVTVTVSMGATLAELSGDIETILREADTALYQAKNNGRNRVEQSARKSNMTAKPG